MRNSGLAIPLTQRDSRPKSQVEQDEVEMFDAHAARPWLLGNYRHGIMRPLERRLNELERRIVEGVLTGAEGGKLAEIAEEPIEVKPVKERGPVREAGPVGITRPAPGYWEWLDKQFESGELLR